MSFKYLNLSGLEDLWINIKNYILSKVPTKTSELTNDSGYLTSHQSLDNYVTLNSNQTITAIKTITGGNQGKMIFKNPNFTVGTIPESATTVTRIYFGGGTSYNGSTGVITNDISSDGYSQLEICAINNNSSNSYRASLILKYEQGQTRPRIIKSWGDFVPYYSDNYTLGNSSSIWKECYSNAYYLGTTAFGDIVTHNASEFLTSHQSLSSCVKNVVTNNQTIKSTDITRGTAPSSAQTFGIAFSDNNNKYIGNIYGQYATDKSTYVALYAYKGTTTANNDNASVRVGYDASGNAYTYAPTPATADNSTQIATTAFVKAQGYLTSHQSLANYALDANVVHTSGDETIAGKKSFNAMPSILGSRLGNEFSTNARTCLYLKSNRDTDGQSGIYFSKFRQNVAQGALTGSNLVSLNLDVLENSVRTNSCIAIHFRYFENDVPTKMYVIPRADVTSYMGTIDDPWTSICGTNIYENGTALSSKYAQVDNISANEIGTTRLLAYEPASASEYGSNPTGTTKPGSSLYEVSMHLHNATGYYGDFNSESGEFIVTINARKTQSGTWKVLHEISVSVPQDGARSFAIGMWVRIA